jgi:glycosyltransferase involved in cell wall biosynthesis
MRTVFVIGTRGIPDVEGGAEKNAERLFPLIVQKGWRVVVGGLQPNIKAPTYRGVELWAAPTSYLLKTDKLLYYVRAALHAVRLRPDIVHFQELGSAIFLFFYKLLGCRIVVRYGSADYLLPKWGLLGRMGFRLAEFQLRFADAVIAVTPALAERLRERGVSDNIHVIANAVDARSEFQELDAPIVEGTYILAVGRVTHQKNFHRLIEGFKRFADANPEVKLVIAGGVDDERYVNTEIVPLLDDRVKMLGRLPRSAMGQLYENAAVYVNSSIHEGSSNAVLEAVSWNCPILLSDIPENRDFGLDDDNYFGAEDPAVIADALARAYADQDAYRTPKGPFPVWEDVAWETDRIYSMLCSPETAAPARVEQPAV